MKVHVCFRASMLKFLVSLFLVPVQGLSPYVKIQIPKKKKSDTIFFLLFFLCLSHAGLCLLQIRYKIQCLACGRD